LGGNKGKRALRSRKRSEFASQILSVSYKNELLNLSAAEGQGVADLVFDLPSSPLAKIKQKMV